MKSILITGGTGTLGKALSKLLTDRNINHFIGSRNNYENKPNWVKLDLLKKAEPENVINRYDIIFHLANNTKRETEITQNLLESIKNKPTLHLIYISIVGVDKIPYSYYKQKFASEKIIQNSGIPYSILRATQFNEFVDKIISTLLKYRIGFLPKKIIIQPIQKEIVASALYNLSIYPPTNNIVEIGGIEACTLEDLTSMWLKATNRNRIIFNFPIWGKLGKALYSGQLKTNQIISDSISWKTWLNTEYQ